jgi:RNA polymerase sigma-70 factor, ECF subfamily
MAEASPVAVMEQLHDEHAGALWGYCLRLTGHDRGRAEDLLQETLLRAWRSSRLLDESRGSVRSWLFTVARNLVIDEWRSKRTRSELVVADVPEPDGARDHTDQLLLSWVVADALMRLSDDHRAVLLDCYYRGLSVADAARHLEIPEGTVKSRTHYALRALRLALEEMGVTA